MAVENLVYLLYLVYSLYLVYLVHRCNGRGEHKVEASIVQCLTVRVSVSVRERYG